MPLVPELLRTATVTGPRRAGPLEVFGLCVELPPGPEYRTLDDALAGNDLEVTEVSEGGSVPTLKVVNRGGVPVFLMAGEQLVGAKQNRVLNTSLFVAAGSTVPVPVSCVEQGRWSYQSRSFGSTGTASHGKLRAMMTSQVTRSYTLTRTAASDQGAVWGEVSRKLGAVGSSSRSAALEQSFSDHAGELNDLLAQLTVPEGCNGVAFAVNGRIVGADVFDKPATLARLWPKLVRAFGLDALEERTAAAAATTPEAVRDWLAAAATAEAKPFSSAGVGEDVRLASKAVTGSGLVVEGRPVHVQVFTGA